MLKLISAIAEHEPFLYELYAETRRDELSVPGWDEAQRDALVRMQFNAQRHAYRSQYADLDQRIIYQNSAPVGQLTSAAAARAIVLVDIAVMPAYRNQGIGTALIAGLQEKAGRQGKGVRLHVLQTNPAQRLYTRLGFRMAGERFPYVAMEWYESYYTDSPDRPLKEGELE